jgi:phage baseplate assembly protein W
MNINQVTSSEWGLSLAGFGEIVQGIDDINQCIQIILFTKKGADPLRPEFGCDIFNFVDQPISTSLPQMRREILEALQLFEPRIEVVSISPTINDGQVTFTIMWKFANAVDTNQLDVTYGLG